MGGFNNHDNSNNHLYGFGCSHVHIGVTVIIIDLKRSKNNPNDTVATQPQEPISAEPAVETAEDSVVFKRKMLTHSEKYADLDRESKSRYNEVVAYVCAIDGVKRKQNDKCEEFRYCSKRVVCMTIKKGVVCCEYSLVNDQFDKYISDNKLSVKQAATIIKLLSAKETEAAKNAVDISVETIRRYREEKHQRDLARRREARKRANSDVSDN